MSDLKETPEAPKSGSEIDNGFLDWLVELRAKGSARSWRSFGSLFGVGLNGCTCVPTQMGPEYGGELGHAARCGMSVLGETEDAEDADLIVAAVNNLVPLVERVRELEATVERVRALTISTDGDDLDCLFDGNTVGDIRRALDGA